MFARILEFISKHEKKNEFINVMQDDVLPVLKETDRVPGNLALRTRGENAEDGRRQLLGRKETCGDVHARRLPDRGAHREGFPATPISWKV